ncbi:carbohydrate-binding domain-containing protein [Pedobacter sp. AW1-32]|uniref:carbohydrate-binding domain-containing protein n=1 Tax=Pedobacter sp. AW1-32 TaxID=3383026 RepID=UPI003FEDC93D
MRYLKFTPFALFIAIVTALSSCKKDDDSTTTTTTTETYSDLVTNTQDTTVTNAVTISYASNVPTVTNPYTASGVSITTSEGVVTVTSTSTTPINYVITGNASNGCVKINSSTPFGIVLNGADIISQNGPALNLQSSQASTITLVSNTNNRLIDNATNSITTENGALYSNGNIDISGNGRLISNGNYAHAFASRGGIAIKGGIISITGAVTDGIHAANYFEMQGGSLSIISESNGIGVESGYIKNSSGTLTISSVNDGIFTSYAGTDANVDPTIYLNGGITTITTTADAAVAMKSSGSAVINNTNAIRLTTSGVAAPAMSINKNLTITNANLTISTTGTALLNSTSTAITASSGMVVGGNYQQDAGALTINNTGSGAKSLDVSGTTTFNGGTLTATTTGGTFTSGSLNTTANVVVSAGNLSVNGGTLYLTSSGIGAKGLVGNSALSISGNNTIEAITYDDGISGATAVSVANGSVYCYSTAGNGIYSGGTLSISGGQIVSAGYNTAKGGLYNNGNTFTITGGTIMSVGGTSSSPTAATSTQRAVILTGASGSDQLFHVETAAGAALFTYRMPRTYTQLQMLFSMPELAANTTYSIYTGGSVTGGTNFHNFYTGDTYTRGTLYTTFTTNSILTAASQ